MSTFCPHDFYHRVVVIATCRMNRDPGWLIDDNHVFVFVQHGYGQRSDRRLVPMQGMGYDISILDNVFCSRYLLTIHSDCPTLYCIFLKSISKVLDMKFAQDSRSILAAYL